MRKSGSFALPILGILILLNILAWLMVWELKGTRFLEVNFFDVGQGDAIFIVFPKKQQILIDGGPDSAILEKLAKEMPFWDRTIDLLILTHPESDHLSGLIEVLKRYRVEKILWTGVVKDTANFREWQRLIDREGATIFIAKDGMRIWEGPTSPARSGLAVYMEILHPVSDLAGETMKDANPSSIVIRLDFRENSFLFTGDIIKSVEKELVGREENIRSDVLKVAHHGSKTSSAEEFVKEVSPEIAVISLARNNKYGHPHQEVLETLAKYDITVLRTDRQGDIKIFSDGENLRLKNSNPQWNFPYSKPK